MELLPAVNAPGMTITQFDSLAHKAHMLDLRVVEVVNGVAFVTSASQPGRLHRVTRTTCDCPGHKHTGRCMHRALCVFLADIMGGFGRPAPVAPVTFIHRRSNPQTAA